MIKEANEVQGKYNEIYKQISEKILNKYNKMRINDK